MLTIFLDIDGVLNCWGPNSKKNEISLEDFGPFCNFNEEPLNHFYTTLLCLESSNYKYEIVISSTWRKWYSYDEFVAMGEHVQAIKFIMFKCPRDRWKTEDSRHGFRGDEINEYIDTYKIQKYVCIDDSTDFYNYQPRIKTAGSLGFRLKDMSALIEYAKG